MSTLHIPLLEIAVFNVRSAEQFPAVQESIHGALATLPGFRTSLRLRGRTNGLFADVVAWESLAAAERASLVVREDPRFAALAGSIAELQLYGHYTTVADVDLFALLRPVPVVELAAYAVRDPAIHRDVQRRVHEALRAVVGYRCAASLQQVQGNAHFADLVGWDDANAHRRADTALQQRRDLSPFFSGIEQTKVFELFSVLG